MVLQEKKLPLKGKKEELVQRVLQNTSEQEHV